MGIEGIGFGRVCWAQELFYYDFSIDYQYDKANEATDALSQHLKWNDKEKTLLQAKNSKILY